jgi:methyl-accepting chemotaxis protein
MATVSNVSFRSRFLLAGTLVVGLVVALGSFALRQLGEVHACAEEIDRRWLPSARLATELKANLSEYRRSEFQHILASDDVDYDKQEEQLRLRGERLEANAERFAEYINSEEERALFGAFRQAWESFRAITPTITAQSREGKKEEAKATLRAESRTLLDKATECAVGLIAIHEKGSAAAVESSESHHATAVWGVVVLGAGASLVTAGALIALALSVLRPVRSLTARVQDIAEGEGDLTRRVEAAGRNELATLAQWFNSFLEKLEFTIGQVREGAIQIDSGTAQVASSSQSLAAGATEQASNLEEINASMQDLSQRTRTNAAGAQDAVMMSNGSREYATNCQSRMSKMTDAMSELKESSGKIAKVLRVIDEIAFQTNLLALNAAVEAARAGEAGKGFAVVAEEVRSLAGRSAKAARETAHMVEESTARADRAVQLCDEVGESLGKILDATNEINAKLVNIAEASEEQAKGIDQINLGIGELDKVTQSNAGNSEQLAASSEETSSLTANLKALVERFKVSE